MTRLARLQPVRARIRLRSAGENGRVHLDVARERLRAGQCYQCGGEVADGLARLGSILCHDCRDASLLPAR
jgi:hypothetical protein